MDGEWEKQGYVALGSHVKIAEAISHRHAAANDLKLKGTQIQLFYTLPQVSSIGRARISHTESAIWNQQSHEISRPHVGGYSGADLEV